MKAFWFGLNSDTRCSMDIESLINVRLDVNITEVINGYTV
jgi:hypothetical protein